MSFWGGSPPRQDARQRWEPKAAEKSSTPAPLILRPQPLSSIPSPSPRVAIPPTIAGRWQPRVTSPSPSGPVVVAPSASRASFAPAASSASRPPIGQKGTRREPVLIPKGAASSASAPAAATRVKGAPLVVVSASGGKAPTPIGQKGMRQGPPQTQAAKPLGQKGIREEPPQAAKPIGQKGIREESPQTLAAKSLGQKGMRRESSETPASPAAGERSGAKLTIKVWTQTRPGDIVVTTLVGDYEERGENHGRKYYQKKQQIPGHSQVKVLLYYWDTRDGSDLSGWWFGDSVGGTQVWARASVHTPQPPKTGWRIPWNAKAPLPGALLVDAVEAKEPVVVQPNRARDSVLVVPSAAQSPVPTTVAPTQLVKKATDGVKAAETSSQIAINAAKKVLENEKASEESLNVNADALGKHQTMLVALQNTLAKDLVEARKLGPFGASVVAELEKLPPFVKTLQSNVSVELGKVKSQLLKMFSEKQKVEGRRKEEEQVKSFQNLLPEAKVHIAMAEDAVEALLKSARDLILSGEVSDEDFDAVEKAVVEANKLVGDARNVLNTKLVPICKTYVPAAQKSTQAVLQPFLAGLIATQKKANLYRTLRKDFQSFVDAHKAIAELTEKMDAANAERENAEGMVDPAKLSTMSEESVDAVDAVINSANEMLLAIKAAISQKSKGASWALKEELGQVMLRAQNIDQKLEDLGNTLADRRREIALQKAASTAMELVAAAEATVPMFLEAEQIFLSGMEVLPKGESAKALAESDSAISSAEEAIASAQTFMDTMKAESEASSNSEVARKLIEVFPSLTKRLELVSEELARFSADTDKRRVKGVLNEFAALVIGLEKKLQALKNVAKILYGNLDEVPFDEFNEAIGKCRALEREVQEAFSEAKKFEGAKQRSLSKGDFALDFEKAQSRLAQAQTDIAAHKTAAESAEKLMKAKEVLQQQKANLVSAEAEVEKAEVVANSEDIELTAQAVKDLDEALGKAVKLASGMQGPIQSKIRTEAARIKEGFEELLAGAKSVEEKVTSIRARTKARREKVLIGVFAKEGDAKVMEVEACVTTMTELELPFLKGFELLPLAELQRTVLDSEQCIEASRVATAQAKSFIAAKSFEAKAFDPDAAKEVSAAMVALLHRLTEASQQVSAFISSTADRKKSCEVQEVGEKVDEAVAAVAAAVAAAAPFLEDDADKMSSEEAEGLLKTYLDAEGIAKGKLAKTRASVVACQRFAKDVEGLSERVQKLLARLVESEDDLNNAKKPTVEHEMRCLSKTILADVVKRLASLEEYQKKAVATCAPLLERGGEDFLVHASIDTLAEALAAYMSEKNLDIASLFKEVCNGSALDEAAWVSYLKALPEAIEREEVRFEDERCKTIFSRLDQDKTGFINEAAFRGIFRKRCVCKKGATITDKFSIADGKLIATLQSGDAVETVGIKRVDESGLVRCEVQTLGDEKIVGWTTLRGNIGTKFFEEVAPFMAFCQDVDRVLQEVSANVTSASTFIIQKLREGGSAAPGTTLAEARLEVVKMKPILKEAGVAIEALTKSFANGKREYFVKENAERNAHILAKNAREAAAFVATVGPVVDAMVQAASAVVEAAKPFTSLPDADVESFENPTAVLQQVEALAAIAAEREDEARSILTKQLELVAKATPQTAATTEAKKLLAALKVKLEAAVKSCKNELGIVKTRCKGLTEEKFLAVQKACQKEVEGHAEGDVEGYFTQLSEGKDEVSQDAFAKMLGTLTELNLKPQHIGLVCQRVAGGNGGISRRSFLSFVQRFMVVATTTAMTTVFEVSTTKTLRKVNVEELLEVLEGPQKDEACGILRVRVRALSDSRVGWMSVMGNQGTNFLEETPKPFLKVHAETPLENNLAGDEVVRKLAENEVLEVISGPIKRKFADVSFGRVRSVKDGVVGWMILKDHLSEEHAAPNALMYKCKAITPITEKQDVKEGSHIRNLTVGEFFEAGEDVVELEDGAKRVKGKALKDGKEGWITLVGQAGTVFVEPDPKSYVAMKSGVLRKFFGSSAKADVIRRVEEGEALQLIEGPKEEKAVTHIRYKVRALDRTEGWVTKTLNVRDWYQEF